MSSFASILLFQMFPFQIIFSWSDLIIAKTAIINKQ